jgi:hypothetical protein
LFDDKEMDENRKKRDLVKPAQVSVLAKKKKIQRLTLEGLVVQCFDILLKEFGTRCRNRCQIKSGPKGVHRLSSDRNDSTTEKGFSTPWTVAM